MVITLYQLFPMIFQEGSMEYAMIMSSLQMRKISFVELGNLSR